jgi:hypothetical protein
MRARKQKKHDKKKAQGKKKKNYWPSKLTLGGQFHPIHEIPWNSSFILWFPSDHWTSPIHEIPWNPSFIPWFPSDHWTSPMPGPSTVSWVITITDTQINNCRRHTD